MRISSRSIILALLLATTCTAFGAGSGDMATPSDANVKGKSPELLARQYFSAGVNAIEKGDGLLADEARQSDARKKQKAHAKADQAYATALRKFAQVISLESTNVDAWNYVGYAQRRLGHYEESLTAYARVLSMRPGYALAIEYRGHAFLGLDRLSEAKEAYLTLFPNNRKLAATLLEGMQQWVAEHRRNPVGVDAPMVETFAAWVSERTAIAGQTAALTREGAASAWH
jgi:tetratricopeptide (TPR) repeat protein